jgi:hypothetical protein
VGGWWDRRPNSISWESSASAWPVMSSSSSPDQVCPRAFFALRGGMGNLLSRGLDGSGYQDPGRGSDERQALFVGGTAEVLNDFLDPLPALVRPPGVHLGGE